jgi:CDGSH-type Zn-finger protein
MARDITHEANGPYIIDEEEYEEAGGPAAICQCGLSANKPYCDGSHQATGDEEDGVVYRYEGDDDGGERSVVRER